MSLILIPNFRKPNRKILQDPDPRLRKVSKAVVEIDKSTERIAHSLRNILKEIDKPYLPWLGMAAPQLGYNQRVIAIKLSYHEYQVMINPKVLEKKWSFPAISGCYSLSGLYVIKAPYWSKVKYQDLYGKTHAQTFRGAMSVLIDQEIEHLDGKLICNKKL